MIMQTLGPQKFSAVGLLLLATKDMHTLCKQLLASLPTVTLHVLVDIASNSPTTHDSITDTALRTCLACITSAPYAVRLLQFVVSHLITLATSTSPCADNIMTRYHEISCYRLYDALSQMCTILNSKHMLCLLTIALLLVLSIDLFLCPDSILSRTTASPLPSRCARPLGTFSSLRYFTKRQRERRAMKPDVRAKPTHTCRPQQTQPRQQTRKTNTIASWRRLGVPLAACTRQACRSRQARRLARLKRKIHILQRASPTNAQSRLAVCSRRADTRRYHLLKDKHSPSLSDTIMCRGLIQKLLLIAGIEPNPGELRMGTAPPIPHMNDSTHTLQHPTTAVHSSHTVPPEPTTRDHILLLLLRAGIEPNPGPVQVRGQNGIYFEEQKHHFCVVHALNAAMGYPMISGEAVLQHCKKEDRRHALARTGSIWPDIYDRRTGNFSTLALNNYLETHSHPRICVAGLQKIYPTHAHSHVRANSTRETILQNVIPLNVHCFMLHANNGTGGHATCVKQVGGDWYEIDSMSLTGPKMLCTKEDWGGLHGAIYVVSEKTTEELNIQGNLYLPQHTERHDHLQRPTSRTRLNSASVDAPYKNRCIKIDLTHDSQEDGRAVPSPALEQHQIHLDTTNSTPMDTDPCPQVAVQPQPSPALQLSDPTSATPMEVDDSQSTHGPGPHDMLQRDVEHVMTEADTPDLAAEDTGGKTNSVRIMTLNCRGAVHNSTTLEMVIEAHTPDIMFLTETKMVSNHNKPKAIARVLADYKWGTSSTTRNTKKGLGGQQPNAGVIVAVRDRYASHQRLTTTEPPEGLAGYVCHTTILTTDQVTLHLIGVYAPEDTEIRASIFKYLTDQCETCRTSNHRLLIGGDWNAVLTPGDRNTGLMDTADRALAAFAAATGLGPLHTTLDQRPTTYTQMIHNEQAHMSRIDDVWTMTEATRDMAAGSTAEAVPQIGGNLDHSPLLHSINHPFFNLPGALPPDDDAGMPKNAPQQPAFVLPFNTAHLEMTRQMSAATHGQEYANLRKNTSEALKVFLDDLKQDHSAKNLARVCQEHPGGGDVVDALAHDVQAGINATLGTMRSICTLKPVISGKIFLKRTVQNEHRKLWDHKIWLKQILRAYNDARSHKQLSSLCQHSDCKRQLTHRLVESMPRTDGNQTAWDAWTKEVCLDMTNTTNAYRQLVKDEKRGADKRSRIAFQQKLATRPKIGHREIFSSTESERGGPHAMRHPDTKVIHHTKEGVLEALQAYHSKLMTPSFGPKTGKYLPEDVPRLQPWSADHPDAIDTFELDTLATRSRDSAQLLDHMMDRATLDDCIGHLARGKKTGEDGVPNELIQILPEDMKAAIHNLFTLMWVTGRTPKIWKTSNTILLFKKGDKLDPANYRPISIANTIYKLWTSTVTSVLSTYAEAHNMLSSAQEGFRAHKNTGRQLRNLVQLIEDAALTGNNMHMLYVDLSSAFNMVDHDKLLCNMHDLGFPRDAIDTIKDIYTNSVTIVQAAGGTTQPIQVNRGTIQGDTLSPFLFLLFLEPLLRWLHVGGRGYNYGCLTDEKERAQHICSAVAYADDLGIPANTPEQLMVQTKKLDLYCTWSGLSANASKCCVTGILYGDYANRKATSTSSPTSVAKLRDMLEGKVTLGGKTIPFLAPDKPYKYLGVWITLTLDWSHQLKATMEAIRSKGAAISSSMASYRQRLHMIKTCIKPGITYCFSLAPYTDKQITKLDNLIAQQAKTACNLPRSMPNAAILLEQAASGLGLTSLHVDYIQLNVASLIRALNDQGRLGAVTRGLLKMQNERAGDMIKEDNGKQGRFYMALKQLAMCQDNSLQVVDEGTEMQLHHNELWAQLLKSSLLMPADIQTKLKPAMWHPLSELNIDLSQIINSQKTHFIDTHELERRVGKKIQDKHKRALNRVTLILTHNTSLVPNVGSYMLTGPLDAEDRRLPEDWVHRESWTAEVLPHSLPNMIRPPLRATKRTATAMPQTTQRPPKAAYRMNLAPDCSRFLRNKGTKHTPRYTPQDTVNCDDTPASRHTHATQCPKPELWTHIGGVCLTEQTKAMNDMNRQALDRILEARPSPPMDTFLTNRQRQGDWQERPTYSVQQDCILRRHVRFTRTPADPDTDIEATNSFLTQLGLVNRNTLSSTRNQTAFVYLPSGRCIGEMTENTYNKLIHSFNQSKLDLGPTATPSPPIDEALARLLTRYTQPSHTERERLSDSWVAPDGLIMGLSVLGVRHERFASPLDRSQHLPVYSSRHPEDTSFGARGDAFLTPWRGANFAHPGRNHKMLTKSVRWAVGSAILLDEPVLTVMLLPRMPESEHSRYLGHPCVHDMGTAYKISLTKADYWKLEQDEWKADKKENCDYKLFAVANAKGISKWLSDDTKWDIFSAACSDSLGLEPRRPSIPTAAELDRRGSAIVKHPQALKDMICRPVQQQPHTPKRPRSDTITPTHPVTWRHPLRTDPLLGAYTDGSCTKQQGGPNSLGAAVRHHYLGGTHMIHINPCGHSATNTINRAELSAIHTALTDTRVAETQEDLTIYTDSQCSMDLMQKMMYTPARMLESKHHTLAAAIKARLLTRSAAGANTWIQKVKSHAGVVGNEEADKAATAVAKGHIHASECVQEPSSSLAYQTIAWVAKRQEEGADTNGPYFLNDLSAAIKGHLMPTLQAGQCNDTLYVQLNRQAASHAHTKHSNYMWEKSSNITFRNACQVLKMRWGQTFNQKRAVQFKLKDKTTGLPLTSSACLMCGKADGPSHIFGACEHPDIKAHVISRHNQAVLILHKALRAGKHGGSYCIVDATAKDCLPEGVASNRLPAWLLPNMNPSLLAKKRPDILLIKGLPAREAEAMSQYTTRERKRWQRRSTILIIEVGYASDFMHAEKQAEKRAQHAELDADLGRAGWTQVERHTVVLGKGGMVFSDAEMLLDMLGVPHTAKETALRTLNCLAALKIRDMLMTRRKVQAVQMCPREGIGIG